MQSLSQTTSSPATQGHSLPAPLADCAREVLAAVPPLLWYIRLHMRRHRQGLSVPQFTALVKVGADPAITLSRVAEHLGASLPTASRTIDTLVAKGYLARKMCADDRRQCRLSLTPRGRRIVETARAVTQSQMESQLVALSPGERDAVSNAMQLLRNIFEPLQRPAEAAPEPSSPLKPKTPKRRRASLT